MGRVGSNVVDDAEVVCFVVEFKGVDRGRPLEIPHKEVVDGTGDEGDTPSQGNQKLERGLHPSPCRHSELARIPEAVLFDSTRTLHPGDVEHLRHRELDIPTVYVICSL